MQRFYSNELIEENLILSEEESYHCVKILRKKAGDSIELCDGKGRWAKAVILKESIKNTQVSITESTYTAPGAEQLLTLAIAPTKNADRMEWMVEKAVEIGVGHIIFVFSSHSERREFKTDRVLKKAIAAMKQSGRLWLPAISVAGKVVDYAKKLPSHTDKWIAYLDEQDKKHLLKVLNPHNDTVVLIGPEGDFDEKEIKACFDAGFKPVHLGPARLRTETAGLYAVNCFAAAVVLTA